jgi:eukaryotic-like serine/threonine-protein kinase
MKRCPRCRTSYPDHAVFCATDGLKLEFETAPADALIGTTLDGKYQIERMLGEGGMGRVYSARHLLLDRTIAVKVLNSSMQRDSRTGERFRREAQAAGRLQHPNAVIIHDFGITSDGNAYLVMELLHGSSLRALLQRNRRLSPELASEILGQVAAAIDQAHALGIIHRDLKPDNIMVDERPDGRLSVKVLDFGIAKLKDLAEQNIQLTGTGMVIGTVHYMSPEQCRATELDGRSDIYSLGIVLFEMLTGRVPFDATTPTAIIVAHVNDEPPAMKSFQTEIPEAAQKVVLSALAKRPEDRPQTAGELARRFAAAVAAGWGEAHAAVDPGTTAPVIPYTLPINSATTRPDANAASQPETMVVPPPLASRTPATDRVASMAPENIDRAGVSTERRGVPAGVWVVLGMLVCAVAVAAVVIVFLLMRGQPTTPASNPNPRQEQASAPQEPSRPQVPSTNAPATSPPPTNATPATNAPATNTPVQPAEEVQRSVRAFLASWTQSSQEKNLPAHMRHYADVVDYYQAGQVPKTRVAADRARAYAKFDTIDVRVSKVHSMSTSPDGSRVEVVLDKSWHFAGPGGAVDGAVKQLIVLERVGGEFRIVKERDLAKY